MSKNEAPYKWYGTTGIFLNTGLVSWFLIHSIHKLQNTFLAVLLAIVTVALLVTILGFTFILYLPDWSGRYDVTPKLWEEAFPRHTGWIVLLSTLVCNIVGLEVLNQISTRLEPINSL
jgi:hypothetical protein